MSARENILAKLKKASALPMEEPAVFDYYREKGVSWDSEAERLKHWAAAMRAVKTEIYWVTKSNWMQVFREAAEGKGLKNILLPLATEHGQIARAALAGSNIDPIAFEREIDTWKTEFFTNIDAGFSGAQCGIARTGTLMLFSSPEEPRTLSLVPPVHFCLFDTSKMYNEFHNAVEGEKLVENGMPTNVFLISGKIQNRRHPVDARLRCARSA